MGEYDHENRDGPRGGHKKAQMAQKTGAKIMRNGGLVRDRPLFIWKSIIFALMLLFSGVTHAEPEAVSPAVFESEVAMEKWAYSSFGGGTEERLRYRKQRIRVYLRQHTSGVTTSEPVVFIEKADHSWFKILHLPVFALGITATIEGDSLILWRLDEAPKKETKRIELLKLDLTSLAFASRTR